MSAPGPYTLAQLLALVGRDTLIQWRHPGGHSGWTDKPLALETTSAEMVCRILGANERGELVVAGASLNGGAVGDVRAIPPGIVDSVRTVSWRRTKAKAKALEGRPARITWRDPHTDPAWTEEPLEHAAAEAESRGFILGVNARGDWLVAATRDSTGDVADETAIPPGCIVGVATARLSEWTPGASRSRPARPQTGRSRAMPRPG